jgi:hypothetical protein
MRRSTWGGKVVIFERVQVLVCAMIQAVVNNFMNVFKKRADRRRNPEYVCGLA